MLAICSGDMRGGLSGVVVALLVGCAERPLDSAGDPSGSGTTGSSTAGTITSTSVPTTSSGVTVTGSTGSNSTGSTGAESTSVGASTQTPVFDMPAPPVPPLQGFGCNEVAPGGTALMGESSLGEFVGDRAWFGAALYNFEPKRPTLLVLSPGADAAVELALQNGSTGPVLRVDEVDTEFAIDSWIGAWETSGTVYAQDMSAFVPFTVTISELAGNWDVADPRDPPRLIGSFAGAISGPFDAVYCDKLDTVTIVE